MNVQNNPYNQGPQMPMMPPPPPMPKRRVGNSWRERLFSGTSTRPLTLRQERTLPDWVIGSSVGVFFIAFAACTFAYGYPMEMRYAIISSLSVLLFFYGSRSTINGAVHTGEKAFIKNVFIIGLVARLSWVIYCFFFFNPDYYGTTFGDSADVEWYMPFGAEIAQWIRDGFPVPFSDLMNIRNAAIDDIGYPIWLALVYLLTFGESDVFVPMVIKCLVGAYSAILIFRIAKRHFGEGTARMATLFVALNPNIIFWSGTMMKETEMVFLCCLCIDLVDRTFTSGSKLTFKSLLPGIFAGIAVFFFRAPLAIVIYLAMLAHIVMASGKVMSAGKKIIAGVMVGVVLLIGMGDRLRTQSERVVSSIQSDEQVQNMKWRENRADAKGNQNKLISKYAGAAVFAPLIFTIPFPTFNVAMESQIVQMQLSGGNYIKNIFSFFVILVMILMLISGEWRKHVFIIAYTCGYLAALVFSNFAHSSRFHIPIWPMLMLFAAYGIQISKSNPRYRRWFTIALVVEVVACLGWNYFKLKGRGMI